MGTTPHNSIPGIDPARAAEVVFAITGRLVATLDLQLTLKHIHWNVVGTNFLTVHEMLDTQTTMARDMSDAIAERIRTLGGVPHGTPQAIVDGRDWNDYDRGRGSTFAHLSDLDNVYSGIIVDHRKAIENVGSIDPITEDLLIGQTAELELAQWFVRSFIESVGGESEGSNDVSAGTVDIDIDNVEEDRDNIEESVGKKVG